MACSAAQCSVGGARGRSISPSLSPKPSIFGHHPTRNGPTPAALRPRIPSQHNHKREPKPIPLSSNLRPQVFDAVQRVSDPPHEPARFSSPLRVRTATYSRRSLFLSRPKPLPHSNRRLCRPPRPRHSCLRRRLSPQASRPHPQLALRPHTQSPHFGAASRPWRRNGHELLALPSCSFCISRSLRLVMPGKIELRHSRRRIRPYAKSVPSSFLASPSQNSQPPRRHILLGAVRKTTNTKRPVSYSAPGPSRDLATSRSLKPAGGTAILACAFSLLSVLCVLCESALILSFQSHESPKPDSTLLLVPPHKAIHAQTMSIRTTCTLLSSCAKYVRPSPAAVPAASGSDAEFWKRRTANRDFSAGAESYGIPSRAAERLGEGVRTCARTRGSGAGGYG